GDDRIERDVVVDAEEQVDVGPAVLSAVPRRASHRSTGDAGIFLGETGQSPPHRISMITAVHSAESSRRVAGTPVVKPPLVRIAPSSKRVAELRRQVVLVTHDGVTQ